MYFKVQNNNVRLCGCALSWRNQKRWVNFHFYDIQLNFYSSSSCNSSSGNTYVGQQKPSEPSGWMQNKVRSIGVGSCGTIPCTSRNSLSGNHADSVSSTKWIPNRLKWIRTNWRKIKNVNHGWIQGNYRVMATTGIHMTETRIRKMAIKMHQCGQSFSSVIPLAAFHAG